MRTRNKHQQKQIFVEQFLGAFLLLLFSFERDLKNRLLIKLNINRNVIKNDFWQLKHVHSIPTSTQSLLNSFSPLKVIAEANNSDFAIHPDTSSTKLSRTHQQLAVLSLHGPKITKSYQENILTSKVLIWQKHKIYH